MLNEGSVMSRCIQHRFNGIDDRGFTRAVYPKNDDDGPGRMEIAFYPVQLLNDPLLEKRPR